MRYLAAYLLLQIGGNESPTAKDIKKVISSVGIEIDEDRIQTLLSELKGKDINTVRSPSPCVYVTRLMYFTVAYR